MGLAPSELENITPYQFNLLREGFEKRELNEWERTRFVAWYIYVMAGKVVEDPVSIEAFRPLKPEDLKQLKKVQNDPHRWSAKEAEQAFDYFNQPKETSNNGVG